MTRNLLIDLNEFKEAEKYWMTKFSGEINDVKLLRDFLVPDTESHKKKSFKIPLGKNNHLTEKLLKISKNNHLSLYIILLSAFKVLISRYTGQRDIIVATPIYSPANEKYNKNVALRDFIDFGLTFKGQVIRVRETVVAGYKNEHYSIEYLSDWLDTDAPVSLFRFVLLLESIHKKELIMDRIFHPDNDFTMCVALANRQNNREHLELEIVYNSNLFKKTTLELLVDTYSYILEQAVDDINIRICDMEFMREEEKQRVLVQFNNIVDNRDDFCCEKTLHQWFEFQVGKTPGNTAVRSSMEIPNVCDELKPQRIDLQVTYEELDSRVHQLAVELWHKGFGPNRIAALMVKHPLEIVVGIWGILKAGAAYLPLDSTHPVNVNNRILRDSKAHVLVTEKSLAETLGELASSLSLSVIYIDEVGESEAEAIAPEPLLVTNPANLAYVIYTSGTTGTPKGTLVEHKGVVNYTLWRIETLGLSAADVTLQPLSYCFDGFVSNFFSSLLSGGTLYMAPDSKRMEPTYIKEVIAEYQITNVSLVPGMYNFFLDSAEPKDLKSLRFVVLAGDESAVNLIKKSKQKAPHVKLLNEYGPTEATVTAAARSDIDETNTAIIGQPISNVRIYILDNSLKPLPVNAPGELHIAEAGVARGYLNNPELTAEKFIENPYKPGNRFYKTGDLGRWLTGREIEFIGRIDHQVKIRGYRIELGEIENRLLSYEQIKEAVVISNEDESHDKYLCAYIVSDYDIPVSALREFLLSYLPDYMIPAHFSRLERIPLTPNGKIDRKALPAPQIEADGTYVAPRDEIEKKLVEIWAEVLGRDPSHGAIGIDDNFFALGGHSLKAITMITRIHQVLHVKIVPLTEVFKTPTIRELAENINREIKESVKNRYQSIEKAEKKEYYATSSAQKRLFILRMLEGEDSTNYNIFHIFLIKGKPEPLKMEESFRTLIQRHESLRTSFNLLEENPIQIIHPPDHIEFKMEYKQCEDEKTKKQVNSFIKPFDLTKAPIFKASLLRSGEDRYILMVGLHHIIADGTSIQLLIEEFNALYHDNELPELKLQYKDYSEWQAKQLYSGEVKKQEAYWLNQFKGEIPVLNVPTDFPRPAVRSTIGNIIEFQLDRTLTLKIKQLAVETGTTLYMILLAALNILLAKYTWQEENIVVGTPVSGRNHANLLNLIGTFANMLAMKNSPHRDKTAKEFLEEVKENSLSAYENQDYQFEQLLNKLGVQTHSGRNPLFDVVLNMINVDLITNNDVSGKNDKPGLENQLIFESYEYEDKSSLYDLLFRAVETTETIQMSLEYSTALFKQSTIKKMIKYYVEILNQVVENKDIKIKEITVSHGLIPGSPENKKENVDFNF